MKRLILIVYTSLVSVLLYSQSYKPFNFSSGEWYCSYSTKGGLFISHAGLHLTERVKFYCNGDTLLNDTLYYKLYFVGISGSTPLSGYLGGIRNDIMNKKVWFKGIYFSGVLYDFNLREGDSIKYYDFFSTDCNQLTRQYINSIDSVAYCGNYYKRFNSISSFGNHAIIEGIGSINGLLPKIVVSEYCPAATSNISLDCYIDKDNSNCESCDGFTDIKQNENVEIDIYPNPTSNIINIVSHFPISSIEVNDLFGRLIYCKSEINDEKLSFIIQQNGIYILTIKTLDRTIIRKIIKK